MTSVRRLGGFLFATVSFLPASVFAQVVISEIMYDVPGADTDREWIEVFNSGGSAIDLSTWKLFEANASHIITTISGGTMIAPGAYAVIADNAPTFLTDHPSFSGQLFDSTFSLSNTGETIALRDTDAIEKDSLSYTSTAGATGDGNTLRRTSVNSTTLVSSAASPGTGSLTAQATTDTTAHDMSADTESIVSPQDVSGSGPVEPQIISYAGKDRMVVVGADSLLEGKVFTKSGEPLEPNGIRFLWNFGDGKTAEGPKAYHAWTHPGRYAVTLDVSASTNSASHRIIVTAKPAVLEVSILEDGSVVVKNKNDHELDLSFWHVRSDGHLFTIPEDTVVLVKENIIIPPDSLGFTAGLDAVLLYPNGAVAGTTPPPKPFIAHVAAEEPPTHDGAVPAPKVAPTKASAVRDAGELTHQIAAVSAVIDPAEEGAARIKKLFNAWTIAFVAIVVAGSAGAYLTSRANKKEWEITEETP
ncbi:lamin tail domain-containing protein [Candidatus Kaiserbacteria bacterium]|nr:lamin tail domain-containing protein [Candidatus Kaiserbacteria bacterium]